MTYRRATLLPGTLVVLLLAACGGGGTSGAPTSPSATSATTVTLRRLAFSPSELTVGVGTTVTWRSEEPIGHTVTSGAVTGIDPTTGLRSGETPDGRFDAPLPSTGATHSFTFTEPGTYSYYCAIHQGMNAQVSVR